MELSTNRSHVVKDTSVTETEIEDVSKLNVSTLSNMRPVAVSAALTKRIPKIKVQHNSNEFTVLRAVMNEINCQKVVVAGVTHDDSITTRIATENSRMAQYQTQQTNL